MYALFFDKRVEKDLANLPRTIQVRVMKRLEALQRDPFAGSLKLRGEDSYRARVGDYRIVFDVDTKARSITVLKVAHRKEVYRR